MATPEEKTEMRVGLAMGLILLALTFGLCLCFAGCGDTPDWALRQERDNLARNVADLENANADLLKAIDECEHSVLVLPPEVESRIAALEARAHDHTEVPFKHEEPAPETKKPCPKKR